VAGTATAVKDALLHLRPAGMLRDISADLRTRGISSEAIHIDAWE
jgi:hypothetical protein